MTALTEYTVPALKALAKQKGFKGYSDMNKTQLLEVLNGSAKAEISTPEVPAGVNEDLGIPGNLKRKVTPETKAQADAVVKETVEGKRDWKMPKSSAVAQSAAKRVGARKSSAEMVWEAKGDKGVAELPKQAQEIVEYLRSAGKGVAFPVLCEKLKFTKTRQDPKRIIQFYRSKLIQGGFIRIVKTETGAETPAS